MTPVSEARGSGRAHFSGSQLPVVVFLYWCISGRPASLSASTPAPIAILKVVLRAFATVCGRPNSASMSSWPERADSFIDWSTESIFSMVWLPVGDFTTRMMFFSIIFSRHSIGIGSIMFLPASISSRLCSRNSLSQVPGVPPAMPEIARGLKLKP